MFTSQRKEEFAIRSGLSFFWASANPALATGNQLDVILETANNLELFLTTIICSSDAGELSWQIYSGTTFTPNTPETINSRNPNVNTPAPVVCYTDPALVEGTPVFPIPRIIIGEPAPGSESRIYEELLTGGYIPPKNEPLHLRFFNDSGVTVSLQILMSGRKNI